VQLTKLTAVAVVTRLITDTFHVTVDGCEVTSSWCSDVRLCFPKGAVENTITGKVQARTNDIVVIMIITFSIIVDIIIIIGIVIIIREVKFDDEYEYEYE